jgi:hypothetical protein
MLISCHNMQHNTLARREYKGKIYVKNTEEKKFVGSEKGSGSETN